MVNLPYAREYFQTAFTILQWVLDDDAKQIDLAARMITDSLAEGGVLHVFGAGHAHLFAEEIAYRAGGLVMVNPLIDYGYTLMGISASRSTRLERLEGYVATLFESYDLRPGEVLIIVSQSGINPGPVEAALLAKKRGLQVVAITSLSQSRSLPSRHSSGKRLFEIADVSIDNHVPTGDAVVEIKPGLPRVAAISTVVGASILQSLVAEVAGRMLQRGLEPPVWVSANVPGGDEHNLQLAAKYPSRRKVF